ncbi:hypothetical protein D3C79_975310 [compost metagenome]
MALAAQPGRQRHPRACGPALHLLRSDQAVFEQLGRQLHLPRGVHVVGNDDLVHAQELIDADQLVRLHDQIGLFQDFARNALLG